MCSGLSGHSVSLPPAAVNPQGCVRFGGDPTAIPRLPLGRLNECFGDFASIEGYEPTESPDFRPAGR